MTRAGRAVALVVAAAVVAAALPAAAVPRPGWTATASLAYDGRDGNGPSSHQVRGPAISADGRVVAFESRATNLVPGGTSNPFDVFVRELGRPGPELVSVRDDGQHGNRQSQRPTLSADGRFVAFHSQAALTPGTTDSIRDKAYVHDREKQRTELVSRRPAGDEPDHNARWPTISGNGRWVAYHSTASDIVDGVPADGRYRLYLYDRKHDATVLVSRAPDGTPSVGSQFAGGPAALTPDAEVIAFAADADDLVADDTNGESDVFVYERTSGQVTRVSVDSAGEEAEGASRRAAISADGRYVAFQSDAPNLVPVDTNWYADIFVHDRQTGEVERVSVHSDGEQGEFASTYPSISADGRFVAFQNFGSGLADGPGNFLGDIFMHDRHTRRTERLAYNDAGELADRATFQPAVSADGQYVAFTSTAGNLGHHSANVTFDVYVRNRGPAVGTLDPPVVSMGSDELRVSASAVFAGQELARADGDREGRLPTAAVAHRPDEGQLVFRVGLDDVPAQDDHHVMFGEPGRVVGVAFALDGVAHEIRVTAAPYPYRRFATVLRCEPVCARMFDIPAGLGSTGREALLPVQLDRLGAGPGAALTGIVAFHGLGSHAGGLVLREVELAVGDTEVPIRTVALGVGSRDGDPVDATYGPVEPVESGPFTLTRSTADLPSGPATAHLRVCDGDACSTVSIPVVVPSG